jgi:hypothetical protein
MVVVHELVCVCVCVGSHLIHQLDWKQDAALVGFYNVSVRNLNRACHVMSASIATTNRWRVVVTCNTPSPRGSYVPSPG